MDSSVVSNFQAIDLEGLDRVRLMERMDKKFLLPVHLIPELFQLIHLYYYILEINGQRLLQYQTCYFDTSDNDLYVSHHNGKLNRYKVRKRTYIDTETCFLEVKFKSNKGKTIKQRIQSTPDQTSLSEMEKEFLQAILPIQPESLNPTVYNHFKRVTLTDKKFTERCTIDFSIQFSNKNSTENFDELAIIELKQDRNSKESILNRILQDYRTKPTGFSKYCIGRVLTDHTIKKNVFKSKVRQLNKLIQS